MRPSKQWVETFLRNANRAVMVSSSEKRRLLESCREPVNAWGVIAKSVAGLLIVALVALFGTSYSGEGERDAGAPTPRVVSGR